MTPESHDNDSLSSKIKTILDPKTNKSELYQQRFDRIRELIKKEKRISGNVQIEIAYMILIEMKCITPMETNKIWWYHSDLGIWKQNAERIIRKICSTVYDRMTNYCINEIIDKIRRTTYKYEFLFDRQPIIVLEDGVINVHTYDFSPHSHEYYATRAIPVTYDSWATCPTVDKFLSEVTSPENVQILEEAIGYCLYPGYPYHRAILLLGPTHTGKGTFVNLLRMFLGTENVTNLTLQQLTGRRFSVNNLRGKLANLSPDLPSKNIYDTGIFKALVGEDTISADVKYLDPIEFQNTAKLMFTANTIPPTEYDDSDAYYIRWIICDFPNQFIENADTELLTKMTTPDELSGLLNMALEGLRRLRLRGRFEETVDIEGKKEMYLMGSNTVKAFVYSDCKVGAVLQTEKEKLYQGYKKFCEKLGRSPIILSAFSRDLKRWVPELVISKKMIEGKRVPIYKGVCLGHSIQEI